MLAKRRCDRDNLGEGVATADQLKDFESLMDRTSLPFTSDRELLYI